MKYGYYRDIGGFEHRRPVVEVTIIGRTHHSIVRAIVDSGADYCFFPKSTAVDAGYDVTQATPFPSVFVGRETIGKIIRTPLLVRGRRVLADVIYIDDDLLYGLGFALLGRNGIFSQFREVAFLEKVHPKVVEFRC